MQYDGLISSAIERGATVEEASVNCRGNMEGWEVGGA